MDTHQPNMEAVLSVENLISLLLSTSEEKKSEGESMFDSMKEQDPNSLALHLAQLLGPSDSHDVVFRQVCAYLLEKLLTQDKNYVSENNLSLSTKFNLKAILFTHINLEECSGYIMDPLYYTVSGICNISNNNWPELFNFLHECITSNSNRLKDSFFYIFSFLSQDICQKLFPDTRTLHSLFLKTMNDDALNICTRGAALAATMNFILCLSSLNELKRDESLYPAMMKTLDDALSQDDQNSAQYMLQHYIKLAKNEPRFFRIHIVDVVNTMFEITENMNLEDQTRHLALEFLSSLVEAREKAPGMMKKLPRFTHSYFALLLNMLLDVKDEPSWHISAETYFDWTWASLSCLIGLNYLSRFSNALGGKTVAPVAIEQLDAYLDSQMWEKRHATFIALIHISKGCSKVVIKYLERLVSMVLPSFKDPHPRVRWAAIKSISEFSIVFSPHLQEQHHNQVVPALAAAMDDFEHPRLQAITVRAVHSYFSNSINPETPLPYLDEIFNKLLLVLQRDNQMVQEEALLALSAVASSTKGHFQKYYDFIMPHLKTIIANANDISNQMLHSKALACISMIEMTVGGEKIKDDIKQVIEVLMSSQESTMKEFGTIYHILKAWVRIGSCMGKDFSPYMSTVMPLLVKCAQLQHDNIIDESYDSIHKVKFGDEMIYAKRRDLLEVKSIACGIFSDYAKILEEDFYPWISQVTSILVPLLKFYVHIDVRKKASTALSRMLKSAKLAVEKGAAQGGNESYFQQLSSNIIRALEDASHTEPDTEVCAHILHELDACVQICGLLLNEDLVRSIIDVIKFVITESSRRREELKEREKSEDFDAEEDELLMVEREKEEFIFVKVGYILTTLIKTFKTPFLPFLDELSSYLMPDKDKTSADRITCFYIFLMLVENCDDAAQKYYSVYLPFLLESSDDENPKIRQNALYGLGLCAEHDVSIFKPFVGEVLPNIKEVITYLHAREPENEHAFNNAAYAFGKICQFHRESIDSPQIISAWLNCLPVKHPPDNFKCVHDQLCLMVERLDMDLLGPNYEHFPKIMSVFAEVLCAGKDYAREETLNRMINVLRNLQKIIPPATWALAWSLLLPQYEMELESILSLEEDTNFSSEQ